MVLLHLWRVTLHALRLVCYGRTSGGFVAVDVMLDALRRPSRRVSTRPGDGEQSFALLLGAVLLSALVRSSAPSTPSSVPS